MSLPSVMVETIPCARILLPLHLHHISCPCPISSLPGLRYVASRQNPVVKQTAVDTPWVVNGQYGIRRLRVRQRV